MYEILQNELNIQKIVLACYVPKGTAKKVHKNRPCHGLAFNCAGAKQYVFSDGKSITTEKNSIIFLPQNSSYTVKDTDPGDCYAVNFKIDLPGNFKPFIITAKNSAKILELFKTAEHIWTSKNTGYMLKCKSLLYEIIYLLQKEYNDKYIDRQKKEMINSAVIYIHNNYLSSKLSITELSKMCNITPEYFRKIFKYVYGSSPAKYINDLKLEHAKELLMSGQYSVTESMLLSGFDDPAYFSHRFKKKYGISPKSTKEKQ